MENKSDGQTSSKCLPSNIETLPRRLQRKIISGSDIDNMGNTAKGDTVTSPGSRKLSIASPGILSVCNSNIYLKQSVVNKSQEPSSSNHRPHQSELIKTAKWLDVRNINCKNNNLVSCIEKIKTVERELCILVEERLFLDKWETYTRLRHTLQTVFQKMLTEELKFCCKENVEHYFWKVLYYSSIETMKKLESFNSAHCEKTMLLINEGLSFYENILKLLQTEYHLNINSFPEMNSDKVSNKNEILAKVSAQKILINLGDLSRYKEQIEMTGSYKQARDYYEKAQELLPTNGIPYNQMAILAIYSKKKFDAIYYHMRSLMASNPIHSAKESLKVLFDEIRKKQDSLKSLETSTSRDVDQSIDSNMPMRQEIWIHPNGSRRLHRMSSFAAKEFSSEEDHSQLKSMDSYQLKKLFMLSFLNIHGKLFTGIGMESFDFMANRMLMEFNVLLSHSPLIFTYQRLLQIVSLNIFSICYNNRQEIKIAKKEIRSQAFTIGSIMFGMILRRINVILCDNLFTESKVSAKVLKLDAKTEDVELNPTTFSPKHNGMKLDLPNDVNILNYAIKVWCSWLINYDDMQNSILPFSNFIKFRQLNVDPWKSFAKYLTMLFCIRKRDDLFVDENSCGAIPVLLDEDVYLRGFSPLKSSSENSMYCHKRDNCEMAAEAVLRLRKIFEYANDLCKFESPMLKNTVDESGAVVFIGVSLYNAEANTDDDNTMDNQEDFEEITDFTDELNKELSLTSLQSYDDSNFLNDNPEVFNLIKRKNELEKRQKMQDLYHQKLQGILQKNGISLCIEVRPKYLVPDTNCFIDFLDKLKILSSNSERFSLMVPITVVNELEGLSKGLKTQSTSLTVSETENNLTMVSRRSKAALECIRSKNSGMKCVTTKGSILNSSVFTLEENDIQISNDDKILQTALNLCKNNVDKYEDGIHYIETEVVLLTKDRNLRVKALSRNLPVSHSSGFLDWAGYAA